MDPIQIKGDKDTAGMVPKGEHLLTLEILVHCTVIPAMVQRLRFSINVQHL